MGRVVVTGATGFIGYFVAQDLLSKGHSVLGIDNLNSYYDPALKAVKRDLLKRRGNFTFAQLDIAEACCLSKEVEKFEPDSVIHLAAQAGVRHSITHPEVYIQSNLVGFANILECCRRHKVQHLVYASSSSVYGANRKIPYSVEDAVDHPVSLYAATKRANELMAHSYSHLYGIPTTGLRFFTVYGPWNRPDMAVSLFAKAIVSGGKIDVFNHGAMKRDFTFVGDVAEGVVKVLHRPPQPQSSSCDKCTAAPYKVYNLGNNKPESLLTLIHVLEREFGRTVEKNFLPLQPGDVLETWADVDDLIRDVGFQPTTSLEEGIGKFASWFRGYYGC